MLASKKIFAALRKSLPLFLISIILIGIAPTKSFAVDPPAPAPPAAPASATPAAGTPATPDSSVSPKPATSDQDTTTPPAGGTPQASTGIAGGNNLIMFSLQVVAYGILWLAANLLGMVGTLFNWIVVITVFQYSAYFGNSHGMLIAWGILRDIGNIVLLFGFILISVMVILDIHGFDAKRALPRFIIFAVLMNFSLFASEAIVDLANGLSATLYSQAGTAALGSDSCTKANGIKNDECVKVGIAGTIINDTYLGTALNPTKLKTDDTTQFLVYTGIALFMTIVMVLLLAASIMFFIRAIMLTILLVLSPVAFAAMAIPQLQGRAQEWWNKLLANAFFAPVFLLMIFVGLKVMETARTALGGDSANLANALANPDVSMGGILIVFGLTIGFMVAALQFAKTSGAAGAQFATSFAQKTVQRTMTAPFRATAAGGKMLGAGIYRGTVGAGAAKFSKAYDAKMGQWRTAGGKTEVLAKAARFLKVDDVIHDTASAAQTVKPFNRRSYLEDKKHNDERTAHLDHAAHIAHLTSDIDAGVSSADPELIQKAELAAQKMSTDDIVNYIKNSKDEKKKAAFAELLSADKFEKVIDNKEMAKEETTLMRGRYAKLSAALDSADFATIKGEARKLSEKDYKLLALHNPDELSRVLKVVDDPAAGGTGESAVLAETLNNIKKNDTFTTIQRNAANAATKVEQLKTALALDSNAPARLETISNLVKNMKKEIADLPADKLALPEVAASLDRLKLGGIMAKDELTSAQRKAILEQIKETSASNPEFNDVVKYLNTQNVKRWWGELPERTKREVEFQGRATEHANAMNIMAEEANPEA